MCQVAVSLKAYKLWLYKKLSNVICAKRVEFRLEACKITVSRCTYLEIDFLTAVKQSKKAKLMSHLKPYCSHESLRHKRSIWNISSVFVSVKNSIFFSLKQKTVKCVCKFETIGKLKKIVIGRSRKHDVITSVRKAGHSV